MRVSAVGRDVVLGTSDESDSGWMRYGARDE